jgi:flagellar biosynthesis protein FlhF
MHLKRYRSGSVRDGLRSVREDLGPQALVLSTSMVPARGWRGWLGRREVEIVAAAEREMSEPRQPASVERQQTVSDDGLSDVAARLTAAGLDSGMAIEVAESMPSASRRAPSLSSLRDALAAKLAPLATPDRDYARIEAFVGPPGVGKTSTIAKIASQERARGGQGVVLVAADGFRIGAVEQLRTYAEILEAPFKVARTGDDLTKVLESRWRRPVLVDTAGRSTSDESARELLRTVAAHPDVRTHLVIPAATSVRGARRILDAYAEAKPTRIVLTRLDEAESLSPLVSMLRDQDLPISYVGTGQRVPEDLSRATAQVLAASVLGELPVLRVTIS